MNEILILIGVPGSGKTTFANQFIKSNSKYVIISRDNTRKMLKDSYSVDEKTEMLVSSIQDAAINCALDKNISIVLDNTHCKIKYIKDIVLKFGKKAIINLKIIGSELSITEIKDQNKKRDKVVSEEVVDKMYSGFKNIVKTKKDLLKYISDNNQVQQTAVLNQDPTLPKAIIVDIDGTIAHMNDKRSPFDWGKVHLDTPDLNVLSIIRTLSKKYKIIFVSGRDTSCREMTEDWLDIHFNEPALLYMRPLNDYRKDTIIKEEIFNNEIRNKYYIEMVFDDRNTVVENWRKIGLKVAQVAYGDF